MSAECRYDRRRRTESTAEKAVLGCWDSPKTEVDSYGSVRSAHQVLQEEDKEHERAKQRMGDQRPKLKLVAVKRLTFALAASGLQLPRKDADPK